VVEELYNIMKELASQKVGLIKCLVRILVI